MIDYELYDDEDYTFSNYYIEYDETKEGFDDEDDVSDRIDKIIRDFFINKEHHEITVYTANRFRVDFKNDITYYYEKWIEKEVEHLDDFLNNTVTYVECLDKYLNDFFGELKKEVRKENKSFSYKIIGDYGFYVEYERLKDGTIRILEFNY